MPNWNSTIYWIKLTPAKRAMAEISASGQKMEGLQEFCVPKNFLPASRRFWSCQPAEGGLAVRILRQDFLENMFGFRPIYGAKFDDTNSKFLDEQVCSPSPAEDDPRRR